MSMPSDVTQDISDAVDDVRGKVDESLGANLTNQQLGLAAAAAIAFIGVAIIGPKLTRMLRPKPTLRDRATRRARDARERVRKAARDAGKRTRDAGRRTQKAARRLGGGSIWG